MSAVNLLTPPEPYAHPMDLTFCGLYVVTEFLTNTARTSATPTASLVPVNKTSGGLENSTFLKAALLVISTL